MTDIPAADLVERGLCTGACLVARDDGPDGKCQCRCGGEFHGALSEAPVATGQDPRWWMACDYGGSTLDLCPLVASKRDELRLWKECREQGEPVCWVETYHPRTSGFVVLWDADTMNLRHQILMDLWQEREARLLNRMTRRVLERGRVRTLYGPAPGEYLALIGVRDLDEARTLALIIGECFMGNPCGAVRAIEVLEGRPDPTSLGLDPEIGFPDRLAYAEGA